MIVKLFAANRKQRIIKKKENQRLKLNLKICIHYNFLLMFIRETKTSQAIKKKKTTLDSPTVCPQSSEGSSTYDDAIFWIFDWSVGSDFILNDL